MRGQGGRRGRRRGKGRRRGEERRGGGGMRGRERRREKGENNIVSFFLLIGAHLMSFSMTISSSLDAVYASRHCGME